MIRSEGPPTKLSACDLSYLKGVFASSIAQKKTSAITIDDLPVEAKVNDWSIYVYIYIYTHAVGIWHKL